MFLSESLSSSISSTSSTPSMSSAPSIPSNASQKHCRSQSKPSTAESDDVWGLFIDPAEAEAEIIRHSKILSRRASVL